MDLQKMKVIQTMMDSAKTQADLNFASSMLFDAWKLEVEKKESQVSQMIPKNLRLKFKRTMKLWKNHVEQMSSIRSELFRLDMIEPKYYKIRGLESKVSAAKKAKNMQPYIYNMSRSIYYEEKWIELDVLLNAK
jgi:hypothetical protein